MRSRPNGDTIGSYSGCHWIVQTNLMKTWGAFEQVKKRRDRARRAYISSHEEERVVANLQRQLACHVPQKMKLLNFVMNLKRCKFVPNSTITLLHFFLSGIVKQVLQCFFTFACIRHDSIELELAIYFDIVTIGEAIMSQWHKACCACRSFWKTFVSKKLLFSVVCMNSRCKRFTLKHFIPFFIQIRQNYW